MSTTACRTRAGETGQLEFTQLLEGLVTRPVTILPGASEDEFRLRFGKPQVNIDDRIPLREVARILRLSYSRVKNLAGEDFDFREELKITQRGPNCKLLASRTATIEMRDRDHRH